MVMEQSFKFSYLNKFSFSQYSIMEGDILWTRWVQVIIALAQLGMLLLQIAQAPPQYLSKKQARITSYVG